jgi:hypothetical protein
MNIEPLTYKNMHGEITLHPCYTVESGKVVPMTTSGGHQLYAMPGGAKHTQRKLDVIMLDNHRAKRKRVKDPMRVTFPNGAKGWEFDYETI